MSTPLELIDDYFTGRLSSEEKKAFENRIANDKEFAHEVSLYVGARDALNKERIEQKREDFFEYYQEMAAGEKGKESDTIQIIPYFVTAAAACLLILFTWQFLFNKTSADQIASNFIEKDLDDLSVTMGGTEDTLQLGIAAYNQGHYKEAERLFLLIKDNKNLQSEAVKFLGLTQLKLEQYNLALEYFNELSEYPNLYANPGPFYKAVTLMKRSKGNDHKEAKRLLQEVIDKDLPGKKQAQEWLKELE